MGGSWATRSVKRQQASCGVILVGRSLRRDLNDVISPACLGLGWWSNGLFVLLLSLLALYLSLFGCLSSEII